MIPKIEFRYSKVYDRHYRESAEIKKHLKEKKQEYPSGKETKYYMKKVEKIWRKKEKEILVEIQKISKLKWRDKKIICYVVGCGRSFSEPLTLRIFGKDTDTFIDTLIHELIHQIHIQDPKYMKWQNHVFKKYEKEERVTKTHIALDAIYWKVIKNIFNEKRTEREIKRHQRDKGYARAWEIVQEEGRENVLKKFHKIISK